MQAIEKLANSNNWVTLILGLLFISIFFLKVLDAQKLKQIFKTSFIGNSDDGDENLKFQITNSFQIVIFIFSATVLSFLLYKFKFLKDTSQNDFYSFLSIFFVLITYLFIKRIFKKSLVSLFQIKGIVQRYLKSKSKSLYAICFLLYILILFFEYGNFRILYLFYISLLLFAFHFVYIFVKNKKLIFSKLFYFILYICTLEIAPLLIFYKLIF